MSAAAPQFSLRLARSPQEIHAAQRLRYDVFVKELGGDGPMVDHDAGIEADRFDPVFDHLLLLDEARAVDPVIGVYRLMPDTAAAEMGQYYSEDEYDLEPLRRSGLRLLELGRSCLHKDYRGGAAMFHMWQGLAAYVEDRDLQVLFGVASFHGTDIQALAHPLSNLADRHLAPTELRVRARDYSAMDVLPLDQIDRRRAALETPALIKGYLRLGGFVGEGAFIDRAFNTTDVCLILDTGRMNDRQRALYTGKTR